MSRTASNLPSLMDDHPEATGNTAGSSSDAASNKTAGMRRKERLKLVVAIVAFAAAIGLALWTFTGGPPSIEELTRYKVVVDSKTGEVNERFNFPKDKAPPWRNSSTGEDTLYPAESCFWTKDGKVKLKPTYVLMNEFAGKQGDTICPDCGRKVVFRNPSPPPDMFVKAYEESTGK